MILKVSPSTLGGTIQAPSSKSLSQRFIAASLLATSSSKLIDVSECDDCTAAIGMAAELGAEIELGSNGIQIIPTPLGIPKPRTGKLNAGESGLAIRLFTPIAALSGADIEISSEGTLSNRSQTQMIDGLEGLGLKITSNKGTTPLTISGCLKGGSVEIDGSLGSQFISGLLLALPFADEDSTITVNNLVSRPYLEMTLEVLDCLGIQLEHETGENRDVFKIPANQCFEGKEIEIDGDWSAAATLLTLGALCGRPELEVTGIRGGFTQADSGIKGALLFAGYHLLGTDGGVSVSKKKPRGINLDLTDSPDLFPILAALSAFGKKPSKLRGVCRLQNKESDRAKVIVEEFAKAGIEVSIDGDEMTIKPAKVKPCRIDPRGDHRIAMAAAILGCAGAPIEIIDAECVAKSYPSFFDDIESLGANISTVEG
jgi:3-phosphoshikimate 1-carboxyvinyltransferase